MGTDNKSGQPEGPNIVQSGINAGYSLGVQKREPIDNPHDEGLPFVILRDEKGAESIKYLERTEYPPRVVGTVYLDDAESFLEYYKRQADETSYVYGSMLPHVRFSAVINEHIHTANSRKAAWRDHRAVYPLEHSPEWETWKKQDRQPFKGNDKFAYWLEDVLPDIIAPSPETMMDIALNIKVSQSQGFQKAVNLQNGAIRLAFSNDVTAGVQRPANEEALTIPQLFKISIPVFQGINAPKYEIDARFRFHLENQQLFLRYELVRPHKVVEQAFKDVLTKITTETGKPVLFGKPE